MRDMTLYHQSASFFLFLAAPCRVEETVNLRLVFDSIWYSEFSNAFTEPPLTCTH